MTETLYEVTMTETDMRRLCAALYYVDGASDLYGRFAHCLPLESQSWRITPQMADRLAARAHGTAGDAALRAFAPTSRTEQAQVDRSEATR